MHIMQRSENTEHLFSPLPSPPLCIGVTGGIGSGKSYVCRLLAEEGFPVFYCDDEAKKIIRTSPTVRKRLTELIGGDVYDAEGQLAKPVLAAYLCRSRENAARVDAIVHPEVAKAFKDWATQQKSPTLFMECALLFEAGFDKLTHHSIHVSAPHYLRLQRVMQRDNVSAEKAQAWMNLQMSEEEKTQRADFIICNDGTNALPPQLKRLYCQLAALRA